MANITLDSLPENESTWLALAKQHQISNALAVSIFDYDFSSSGSKVGDKQFLLLRQLWKYRITPFDLSKNPVSDQIVPKSYLITARTLLRENIPWNAYLKHVKESPNKMPVGSEAETMGQFALVLQSQQYTKGLADGSSDDNKIDFSPIFTRSRARELQSGLPLRPRTPATPTPVRASQTFSGSTDDMDIDDWDEFSPSTSSVDQPSPMTGEAARQENRIKSEQEVVFSIILFKRAICNPYKQVMGITWHPHQVTFEAKDKNGEKAFVAMVDTIMRVQGTLRNPSFGETKKVFRYASLQGAPIKAQEACQMAAKIAQQPPENLEEMRAKNLTAREVWWAQDKNEIYIMVGKYNADYVDYISHRPAKPSFAEVQEYGPYTTDKSGLMEELGVIILAYALQQADGK